MPHDPYELEGGDVDLGAVPDALAAQPFVKWCGGKRQLLPELLARMPVKFNAYYEPFVGGGALFFALRARGFTGPATIGDTNWRLVRTYRAIRDNVEAVIGALKGKEYSEGAYYATRANCPDSRSDTAIAAWMIYLNKTGFNGLYRVNKKNEFNVPFGRYTNPTICDADNLRACSAALKGSVVEGADFERTCANARRGDFVYFDPPYMPVSKTSDFTSYTADGFTYDDQVRLRDFAYVLKVRGVHVMLSNSIAAKPIYEKLDGFKVDVVSARRNVNSKASKRGAVEELIIT